MIGPIYLCASRVFLGPDQQRDWPCGPHLPLKILEKTDPIEELVSRLIAPIPCFGGIRGIGAFYAASMVTVEEQCVEKMLVGNRSHLAVQYRFCRNICFIKSMALIMRSH